MLSVSYYCWAGCMHAVALAGLYWDVEAHGSLAVTGEATLSGGAVSHVSGLREKAMAAFHCLRLPGDDGGGEAEDGTLLLPADNVVDGIVTEPPVRGCDASRAVRVRGTGAGSGWAMWRPPRCH